MAVAGDQVKLLVEGGHAWYRDRENGYTEHIDMWRYDSEPHRGPMCARCYTAPCVLCDEWDKVKLEQCPKNQQPALPGMDLDEL